MPYQGPHPAVDLQLSPSAVLDLKPDYFWPSAPVSLVFNLGLIFILECAHERSSSCPGNLSTSYLASSVLSTRDEQRVSHPLLLPHHRSDYAHRVRWQQRRWGPLQRGLAHMHMKLSDIVSASVLGAGYEYTGSNNS